jgi:hypothetical protein
MAEDPTPKPALQPHEKVKYEVRASYLDRLDYTRGFFDDGRPKKVHEHKRGDIISFPGYEEEAIERLVKLKAIKPVKLESVEGAAESQGEQKGGGTPPATQKSPGQAQQRTA